MPNNIKTRFAPSPTGYIHLGNVRTALFNWLCAKSQQGDFLLRIEDTDKQRSKLEYVDALKRDLQWLGLQWQEGPEQEGQLGPYFQSARTEIYEKYYELLRDKGRAYPCFCTEKELEISRKTQRALGRAPRYAGTCASLAAHEIENKIAQGLKFTVRYRVPNSGTVEFDDLVRGIQKFECQDIGDFIIRRSDGSPAFFFSNAIDDALMQVSTVLRGEDHLTNTPRQILILQSLDLPIPSYGHISLIVNKQGSPLSKRDGSLGVYELRQQGYLPLAVINYLARLGHHYSEEAFMTSAELANNFSITHLVKAPARYQKSQLDYWQHETISKMDAEQLWQWIKSVEYEGVALGQLVAAENGPDFAQAIRENVLFPVDALFWAANLFSSTGIYDTKAVQEITRAGSEFFTTAADILEQESNSFRSFSQLLGQRTARKGKQLFMPLRAALTGESYTEAWPNDWMRGPQMGDLWDLLGYDRIKRRILLSADL